MAKHQLDLSVESLTDGDSRFVTVNGIRVHYKELGSGEPALIFLHGFAASLFSWHAVFDPLSTLGRVIAYDRPAFGLTERPPFKAGQGENPYGTVGQVEMLKGLMDALGVSNAILVTHSAGATVGMAFALKYPERVKALVLVGPAVYLYSPVPDWGRRFLAKKPVRIFGQALIHPTRGIVRRVLRQRVYHNPDLVSDEIVNGYEKPFHVVRWEAGLWEFSLAPHVKNLWQRSDELKMPVLVIAGDDDRVIPTRHSRRLAEITPGAKFALIRNCGHVPQEERPGEFVGIVQNFLSEIN